MLFNAAKYIEKKDALNHSTKIGIFIGCTIICIFVLIYLVIGIHLVEFIITSLLSVLISVLISRYMMELSFDEVENERNVLVISGKSYKEAFEIVKNKNQ